MEIKMLEQDFTICQVADYTQVNWAAEFCFTGKTDEEYSLVCATGDVPANVIRRDDGWKGFSANYGWTTRKLLTRFFGKEIS